MTKHQAAPKQATTNLNKEVGDYRNTYPKAPPSFTIPGKKYGQVHHLVCQKSITDRRSDYPTDPDTSKYVEACLQLSGWNINDPVNLLGMPTNLQHSVKAGTDPADLPSHQVDHNNIDGYRLTDVKEYLKSQVWNQLAAKKGKPHDVDVENIKKFLEDCSKAMQDRLVQRGKRGDPAKKYVGTAANWEHRLEPDCSPTWFKPFSMAKNPVPRKPPASKVPLANIFQKL